MTSSFACSNGVSELAARRGVVSVAVEWLLDVDILLRLCVYSSESCIVLMMLDVEPSERILQSAVSHEGSTGETQRVLLWI